MDLDTVSLKLCNQLEQQITEILRTMRSARMHKHPLYEALEKFEQELAYTRRKQYDESHTEFSNY